MKDIPKKKKVVEEAQTNRERDLPNGGAMAVHVKGRNGIAQTPKSREWGAKNTSKATAESNNMRALRDQHKSHKKHKDSHVSYPHVVL